MISPWKTVRKGSICRTAVGHGYDPLFVAFGRPSFSRSFRTPIPDRRDRYSHVTSYFAPTLSGKSHFDGNVTPEDAFRPAKVFAISLRIFNAGLHALFDHRSFHFGQTSDHSENKLSHRSGSINTLAEAHKHHAQGFELLKGHDQVLGGSSEAIKLPNHNRTQLQASGCGHELVQFWAGFFSSRLTLLNKFDNLPAAGLAVVSEVMQLHFTILITGADSRVNGCSQWVVLYFYCTCQQVPQSTTIELVRTNEEKDREEESPANREPDGGNGRQSTGCGIKPRTPARNRVKRHQGALRKEGFVHRRTTARIIGLAAASGRQVAA